MMKTTCLALGLLALSSVGAGQQARFDDVVRNLRNPDPKVRLNAIRLLRDAKYPESIAPMAPLVLDPVDEVQLDAIAAELSFFLDQDVKSKKMIGFVVEKRLVGRVMSDTVQAVGGQCGHMFLRRLPFRVVPGVGGEDDERLTVEISQQRRLMGRRGRRENFLDPASEVPGGCGVGAGLVAGAWRKSAV